MNMEMSLEEAEKEVKGLGLQKIEPEISEQPAVKDDDWERDGDMTVAVNAFEKEKLVPAPNAKNGEGIEIANLPKKFLIGEMDPTGIPRLVTRPEQRRVVRLAYEKSREILTTQSPKGTEGKNLKHVVLAVRGSPGIGKSWSALLYLRHLLNEKERPIIFESGTHEVNRTVRLFVVETTSNGKTWVAYKLKAKELPSEWTQFPDKDVIIDPAQFASGEAPKASPLLACLGHIFLPVSPVNLHLGPTHKTAERIQFVLGPWSYREIMAAWPYMVYTREPEGPHELQEYVNMGEKIRVRYDLFGGLPRYLLNDAKADERKTDMTTEKATIHQELLFTALQDAKIDDRKKVITLFFTLYPGVNDKGEDDPDIKYSTVEFVSRGALKAAGHVIFHQVTKNTLWRNKSDASSVGLAFEAVCLMFLHMGTEGMNEMGIETHCRELLKGSTSTRPAELILNHCPFKTNAGSRELVPVVEASDETEFFESVKASGDQLKIEDLRTKGPGGICVKISSDAPVSFPPPGLANVDGMSGTRLSFQMTLRDSHPPLGLQYIHQRAELGVAREAKSVIVFTVPYENFQEGWTNPQNFSWKGDKQNDDKQNDGGPPSGDSAPNLKKRRRGASTSAAATAAMAAKKQVTDAEMKSAKATLRQFVLAFTLNNAAKANLAVSAPRGTEDDDDEQQQQQE